MVPWRTLCLDCDSTSDIHGILAQHYEQDFDQNAAAEVTLHSVLLCCGIGNADPSAINSNLENFCSIPV